MATYLKQHFHSGPDGAAGILFRTGNFPRSTVFRDLFESTLFKLNASDSATTAIAGHSRIETDVRARTRSLSAGDGWTRFILAHQLPNIIGTVNAEHTLVQAVPYGDLSVVTYDYTHPSGAVRRDFMIYSNLQFISSDGTIDIVGNGAGMYDFKASLGMGDTYKIMLNEFDIVPDYIGNKIDSSLYVTALDKLGVKHDDSQSIQLITSATGIKALLSYAATNSILLQVGAFGLYANLRIADNTLSEDANGVRVTKPCNDINSSDGTITTSYNSLLGTWDIKLASTIGSSGDEWDVQFADGSGGFKHLAGSRKFKYNGSGLLSYGVNHNINMEALNCFVIGDNNIIGGYNSFICGSYNYSEAIGSIFLGNGAKSSIAYSICRGFELGSLNENPSQLKGVNQELSFPMSLYTLDASPTKFKNYNESTTNWLGQDQVAKIEIDVIAKTNSGLVDPVKSAVWSKIEFGIQNIAGTISFIGSPSLTAIAPLASSFVRPITISINMHPNPLYSAFEISGTGLVGSDIKWNAIVRIITVHHHVEII